MTYARAGCIENRSAALPDLDAKYPATLVKLKKICQDILQQIQMVGLQDARRIQKAFDGNPEKA